MTADHSKWFVRKTIGQRAPGNIAIPSRGEVRRQLGQDLIDAKRMQSKDKATRGGNGA